MSETPQDRVHAIVGDLGSMAGMLDAMSSASAPLPLEWLQEWVERLHIELDEAWAALPRGEGVA
ncbi:hypothetical protein AA11826_1263 [Komagataeibacter oboediens DSM 11826]|uniref:Uncharacterized protein n=1 Tax=Komagataeibacter oboediens TaxID=65958 RepID=A0A318QR45_9PROT|nr:hypothetical protein [Komagataeibacter oboediens]PYD81505.1 hypothetical protein CFR80_11275 [Komagataeibacter oboediens]GBR34670.1 hypothetical protein AA11826_1263 [Komagataeibacter oboediens DSM 11826]